MGSMPWIRDKRERQRILFALAVVLAIFLFASWFIPHQILTEIPLHTKEFKHFLKNHGSIARIGFFFVLSYYVLQVMIRKMIGTQNEQVKKNLRFLSRVSRNWHAPVAIFSTGIAMNHSVLAILNGWEWKWAYLSGVMALILLLPLLILGLYRYQRLDCGWHLKLGIVFTVIFLLHSLIG